MRQITVALAITTLGACGGTSAAGEVEPAPAQAAPIAAPAAGGPVDETRAAARAPLELASDHVVVSITARGGLPLPPPEGAPTPTYGPAVIASIRWDGHTECSDDHRRGGPPTRSGLVDVERLRAWIDTLRQDGTFDDPALNRTNVGPDASYVQIDIDLGTETLRMASWHEVDDPTRTIATASGLMALAGRDPAEVMAAEPADYRAFIECWTAIRAGVDALCSASE